MTDPQIPEMTVDIHQDGAIALRVLAPGMRGGDARQKSHHRDDTITRGAHHIETAARKGILREVDTSHPIGHQGMIATIINVDGMIGTTAGATLTATHGAAKLGTGVGIPGERGGTRFPSADRENDGADCSSGCMV